MEQNAQWGALFPNNYNVPILPTDCNKYSTIYFEVVVMILELANRKTTKETNESKSN